MSTPLRLCCASLVLLTGCGSSGIYDTWLVGEVRIESIQREEGPDYANETFDLAEDLGLLGVRPVAISGTTEWFGYKRGEVATPPDELPGKSDEDWFQFTVPVDTTATFTGHYSETPRGLWIKFTVFELTDEAATQLYSEDVLSDEDNGEVDWTYSHEMTAGKRYALRLGGLAGDKKISWTASITGGDPSGMKIGAYTGVDGELRSVASRGTYIGGAEVVDFSLTEDLAWLGTYEVLIGQGVGPIDKPSKVDLIDVDADLSELWLVAMNAEDLAAPMTGGVLYGAAPMHVDLDEADLVKGEHDNGHWAKKFDYIAVDDVFVDTEVPATLGWWHYETEPNDLKMILQEEAIVLQASSLPKCETAPGLTGGGSTDRIEGALQLGRGEGILEHENDCFAITVSAATTISASLTFDTDLGDNLDAVVWNAEGEVILATQGGNGVSPDLSAQTPLDPAQTYYLMVVGTGGAVDGLVPYTVDILQVAQD